MVVKDKYTSKYIPNYRKFGTAVIPVKKKNSPQVVTILYNFVPSLIIYINSKEMFLHTEAIFLYSFSIIDIISNKVLSCIDISIFTVVLMHLMFNP